MLRVLLNAVVLAQPMGGVRRHNAELLPRVARALADTGGSLTIFEGKDASDLALPASVVRIRSSVPSHPVLARATLEGRALRKALDSARADGRAFDLLHTGHLPVPRGLGGRYAITIHDLRALEFEHTPLSRRLVARKLIGAAVERAAAVITVSEHVRAQLLARFRLDGARVHVVPNAADHFTPLERRPGPDAPLLHVGHLEPRKNLGLLLHALALDPGLPRLCLAGEAKHAEGARLGELARELGVEKRVEFRGPFDDSELPQLYAAAAAVVLPSKLEGFGIPALEAQRARVPLAVSRAGALVEVAGADTPNFDAQDAADCARAIRAALCQGPREIERAAQACARFTWDRSAQLLLQAWRSTQV